MCAVVPRICTNSCLCPLFIDLRTGVEAAAVFVLVKGAGTKSS